MGREWKWEDERRRRTSRSKWLHCWNYTCTALKSSMMLHSLHFSFPCSVRMANNASSGIGLPHLCPLTFAAVWLWPFIKPFPSFEPQNTIHRNGSGGMWRQSLGKHSTWLRTSKIFRRALQFCNKSRPHAWRSVKKKVSETLCCRCQPRPTRPEFGDYVSRALVSARTVVHSTASIIHGVLLAWPIPSPSPPTLSLSSSSSLFGKKTSLASIPPSFVPRVVHRLAFACLKRKTFRLMGASDIVWLQCKPLLWQEGNFLGDLRHSVNFGLVPNFHLIPNIYILNSHTKQLCKIAGRPYLEV